MPEDSPRAPAAAADYDPPDRPRPRPPVGGIVRDPEDVRDRSYEPTLARLAPYYPPPDALIKVLTGAVPGALPRLQGAEGTCGGQALATLIDIQRINETGPDSYPASARMIYECARLANGLHAAEEDRTKAGAPAPNPGDGISLRDVIKAFYNYGVCSEERWPYEPYPKDPGQLDVERAQQARKISLGAYYRLRPNLNTYHAALNETGAVVVSAELHDGWLPEAVEKNNGTIEAPTGDQTRGSLQNEKHAFVLVGYTTEGFLVLNSWGRNWGGWAPPGEAPIPGIALWRYADWADTIMDGWALRLGVGAADAFDYSIGDQGLGYSSDASVRATPVHAILGNFLHLDDGDFVRSGGYVSTELTLNETKRFLASEKAKGYKGVLLTFAGGLVGIRGATEHIARQKRLVQAADWYPFTVLWCVDYVEQARSILEGVFAEAQKRGGAPGPRLDRLIEELANGVGRAIWRDFERAAHEGARRNGPLHALARAGAELTAERPEFRLRIVTESEGAIALAELLASMRTRGFAAEAASFFSILESVDLIAPPLPLKDFQALVANLTRGWGAARADRRIRVHLPCSRDEKRLAVAPYSLSYFELVARAFRGERDPLREAAALEQDKRKARDAADLDREKRKLRVPARQMRADEVDRKWADWRRPNVELVPITWGKREPDPQGSLDQIRLIYRSDVEGRLRKILKGE